MLTMKVSKTVTLNTVHTITIGGAKFDLFDLYETLQAAKDGPVRITNVAMMHCLAVKLVVTWAGDRNTPCTKGPKFDAFMEELEPRVNRAYRNKYQPTKASIQAVRDKLDELDKCR